MCSDSTGTDPALQAPPDRVVTHIVPKTGVSGATLTAYAEPDKFKLLVVGSRGLGAFRLCAGLRLFLLTLSTSWLQVARICGGKGHAADGLNRNASSR